MEGIGLVVKVARISRVEGLGQVIPNAFEQARTHSLRAAFAQYVEAALGTGEGNIEQVEIVHYILQMLIIIVGFVNRIYHSFLGKIYRYKRHPAEGVYLGRTP